MAPSRPAEASIREGHTGGAEQQQPPKLQSIHGQGPSSLLGGQAGLSKHSCRHLPASMSCVSQPGSCQGLSCISQFCRPWCSRAVLPAREHHRCRSSALGSRHVAMQGPETAAGRIYRFESATEHHRYRSSALGSRHIAMQGPETAAGRTYRCEFATEHHRCRSSALGSRHIAMQGPETAAGELTNLSLQPRMSAAVPSSTSSARNASASAGLPPTRSQPMGPAAGTTAGEDVKSAQAEAAPSAQLPAATSAWSAEKAVLDEDPTHAEPAAGPFSRSPAAQKTAADEALTQAQPAAAPPISAVSGGQTVHSGTLKRCRPDTAASGQMWTDTPASITRSAGEAAAIRGLECARPEPTHATKLPAAMPAISQAALPIMMPSTSRASAGQLPAARPAVSTSLPTGTPVPSAQQVLAEENLKHVPPEAAPAGQLLL